MVATLAVYYPVLSHPFANYDDPDYILHNPYIRTGVSWTTFRWALTTNYFTVWHPLSWMSHALDYQLYGLDPAGHHATSLLLHLLNVALLFWVLVKATGYAGRSAAVAALFALHPINVESVAWITERKNVLSMFCFLLALGCYHWYASKPRALRYSGVALFYALGLLAKAQVITLPCLLLLWDYWPLRRLRPDEPGASLGTQVPPSPSARSFLQLLAEKIPLFVIALTCVEVTEWALRTSRIPAARWPLHIRVENAIQSYGLYLQKLVWPAGLALFYPHPGASISMWSVVGALLLIAAVTVAVISSRSHRFVVVGWLWFLGTLVPMSGVIPIPADHAMADRYAYLPFIGLFIMICWTGAEWCERRRLRMAGGVVMIALLAALAISARHQLNYWRDNVTLWTHAAEVTRNNAVAEANIGSALVEEKRYDEALVHFRAATVISPLDPVANLDIGYCEQMQGQFAAAVEQYRKVVATTDRPFLKARALNNLGYLYRQMGEPEKARESYAQAAALPEW